MGSSGIRILTSSEIRRFYTLYPTNNLFTIQEYAASYWCLTISTPANNSSRVPNICNKQTITNKNGSGSGRSSISILVIFRFQKFRVGMRICISCGKRIDFAWALLFFIFSKLKNTSLKDQTGIWIRSYKPIADLVSEMNFGWLIKLLNKFCLTYSAARAPPWPESLKQESCNYLHFFSR